MYVSMYVNVQLLDVSSEGGMSAVQKEKIPMEESCIVFNLGNSRGFCLGRVVEGGNLEKGINRPTIYTLPG